MDLFNDQNERSGAILSDDGVYRYQLWRIWDIEKPKVMFMMLNPSTADADIDDPTIKRCIGFAKSWGFGGLYVGNLFAYRSTAPKGLFDTPDPVGIDNQTHINQMVEKCDRVVVAYGNSKIVKKLLTGGLSGYDPLRSVDKLSYIDLANDGTPKHPLYLKGELKLKDFYKPS